MKRVAMYIVIGLFVAEFLFMNISFYTGHLVVPRKHHTYISLGACVLGSKDEWRAGGNIFDGEILITPRGDTIQFEMENQDVNSPVIQKHLRSLPPQKIFEWELHDQNPINGWTDMDRRMIKNDSQGALILLREHQDKPDTTTYTFRLWKRTLDDSTAQSIDGAGKTGPKFKTKNNAD